ASCVGAARLASPLIVVPLRDPRQATRAHPVPTESGCALVLLSGACPYRKTGAHPRSSRGQAFSGTCAKVWVAEGQIRAAERASSRPPHRPMQFSTIHPPSLAPHERPGRRAVLARELRLPCARVRRHIEYDRR